MKFVGILTSVVLVLALVLGLMCFSSVPTGHVGIPVTFGQVADHTVGPGLHFKGPFTDMIKMDSRVQKNTVTMSAFSKDIQETTIVYTINYQISRENAMTIYSTIGQDYFNTVIAPNISEAVKTATAHYTAESLVNNRDKLALEVEEILSGLLDRYHIEIVGTSIEDLDFTDAFTNAVEAKQVAAQNKLKAETEQAQATMEEQARADRAIIAAKAEAEQALIAANADLEVVKVQADAALYAGQKEAGRISAVTEALTDEYLIYESYQHWDGKLPTTILGENTSIMYLPDNVK